MQILSGDWIYKFRISVDVFNIKNRLSLDNWYEKSESKSNSLSFYFVFIPIITSFGVFYFLSIYLQNIIVLPSLIYKDVK